MQVRRRPKFIDDLTDAYAYLAERNPEAADRLLDDVDALVHLLSSFPELGRIRDELRPGVRSFRVRHVRHVPLLSTHGRRHHPAETAAWSARSTT